MATYHGPKERLDAAKAKDTSVEQLAQLARSDYIFVREAVASNPNASHETILSLLPESPMSEDDFQIVLALVDNPSLRPEDYCKIGRLIIQEIGQIKPRRLYPRRMLDAFIRNAHVPAEYLVPLADAETIPKRVRGQIASPGVRKELLNQLLADPSETIRSRARRAMDGAATED